NGKPHCAHQDPQLHLPFAHSRYSARTSLPWQDAKGRIRFLPRGRACANQVLRDRLESWANDSGSVSQLRRNHRAVDPPDSKTTKWTLPVANAISSARISLARRSLA